MNLCSKCKKNVAVVYITRVENGKTIHEGLCVPCAKELGVSAFDQLNQNLNMKPEELENLQNQVMDMFSQEMENFPGGRSGSLGANHADGRGEGVALFPVFLHVWCAKAAGGRTRGHFGGKQRCEKNQNTGKEAFEEKARA